MRLYLQLSGVTDYFTSVSLTERGGQKAPDTAISTAKCIFQEVEDFLWNTSILLKF